MSDEPIDVRAVLNFHISNMTDLRQQPCRDELREVLGAFEELIDAATYALASRDEAGALNSTAEHNLYAAVAFANGNAEGRIG